MRQEQGRSGTEAEGHGDRPARSAGVRSDDIGLSVAQSDLAIPAGRAVTKLKRSELVRRIAARHPDLTGSDVREAVQLILDAMASALSDGKRIEIRNFGSFGVKQRRERVARNPRSGDRVMVPERRAPYFRSKMDIPGPAANAGDESRSL